MNMRFSEAEILVIVRQHVLDHWSIPEDAILGVAPRIVNPQIRDGQTCYDICVDVKVATSPENGGGPYRTSGRER